MSVVKTKNSYSSDQQDLSHKYLTFLLADKLYAVSILKIKEIIEYGTVTPIPTMPSFICGAINIRGGAVPVIDLMQRLEGGGSEIGKRSCIVIVELKHNNCNINVGIIVDSVNRVMDFTANEIEPAPTFGGSIRTDFIEGMGKSNEDFIIILNIDSVLSMEDLNTLMESHGGSVTKADTPEFETVDTVSASLSRASSNVVAEENKSE